MLKRKAYGKLSDWKKHFVSQLQGKSEKLHWSGNLQRTITLISLKYKIDLSWLNFIEKNNWYKLWYIIKKRWRFGFSNAFFVIIKLWCLMLIKNQFHILNNALLRFLIRFVQWYSLQSAFLLKLHQFLLRHFLLSLKNCSI